MITRAKNNALGLLLIPILFFAGVFGVTQLFNFNTQKAVHTQTAALLAHYTFNNEEGAVAKDSAGTYSGVLKGGPVYVAGKVGGSALSFDGLDDYVDVNSLTLDNVNTVTISAWIQRRVPNAVITLGQTTDSSNRLLWEVWQDGNVYFEVANNAYADGHFALNDTGWHHLVMVYDGTQTGNTERLKAYVDGKEQALAYNGTIPYTLGGMNDNFAIGSDSVGGSFYTNGLIDDVRVYDKALTAKEAQDLFSQGSGSFDFSLSNEGAKNVSAGSSVATTITATLLSGVAEPVSFSASGLPPGATAVFSPTPCDPSCSTALTITTEPSTPAGDYSITFTGTASVTRTVNFTLTVNVIAVSEATKIGQESPSLFMQNLSLGSVGEDVKSLQIFLNQQGFIIAEYGPGSLQNETTYFGNLTKRALIKFQNTYKDEVLIPVGLQEGTGYFGPMTRKKVNGLLLR